MRSTWKRVLSAILTIAMIASLVVVPASASTVDGNVTTYVLDAADVTDQTDGTKYDGDYFTFHIAKGAFKAITAGAKEFSDGKTYSKYITLPKYNDGTDGSASISFKTTNAGTCKIYFLIRNSGKLLNVQTSAAVPTTGQGGSESDKVPTVYEWPVAANTTYHVVASGGDNYIYRIEVAETSPIPAGSYSITANATPAGKGTLTFLNGEDQEIEYAAAGDTVKVVAAGVGNYALDGKITVSEVNSGDTDVKIDNEGTFTMPGKAVTVSATFAEGERVKATTVTIKKDGTEVSDPITPAKGSTTPIQLTAALSDGSTDVVFWKSSIEAVATVDQSGKVTPTGKIGRTVITATATADGTAADDDVSATCVVNTVGPDQEGPTYTLDANDLATYGEPSEAVYENTSVVVKYDNYFSIKVGNVKTGFASRNDGKKWNDDHEGKCRINFRGTGAANGAGIVFTTDKAADIKVWFNHGGSDTDIRQMAVYDTDDTSKPLDVTEFTDLDAATVAASWKIAELSVPAASSPKTYIIGGTKANYIYKVEVTEKEAPSTPSDANVTGAVVLANLGKPTDEGDFPAKGWADGYAIAGQDSNANPVVDTANKTTTLKVSVDTLAKHEDNDGTKAWRIGFGVQNNAKTTYTWLFGTSGENQAAATTAAKGKTNHAKIGTRYQDGANDNEFYNTAYITLGETSDGNQTYYATLIQKDGDEVVWTYMCEFNVGTLVDPDAPAVTYVTPGTYSYAQDKDMTDEEAAAALDAVAGIELENIAYQKTANYDKHGPAAQPTGKIKLALDPDNKYTVEITTCGYSQNALTTNLGEYDWSVSKTASALTGDASAAPVLTVYNATGNVTLNYGGFYLHGIKVTKQDDTLTLVNVSVASSIENGTVTLDKTKKVPTGTEINVTATPADDTYELATLTAGGTDIKDASKFTANADTEISATFTKKTVPMVTVAEGTWLDLAVGATTGNTYTAVLENEPQGATTTWSVQSSAEGVATATVNNGVVTVTAKAAGNADITVKANINGTDYTAANPIKVEVYTPDTNEWNFATSNYFKANAKDGQNLAWRGLNVKGVKGHDSYGAQMGTNDSIEIPVSGLSKITVVAGWSWDLSMANAALATGSGALKSDSNQDGADTTIVLLWTGTGNTATLAAGNSWASYVKSIKVEAVTVDSVTVTGAPATAMSIDGTAELGATVTVTGSDDAAFKAVTWSSSDEDVATVNATTGVVTAVGKGTATITATSTVDGTKKGTASVTVKGKLTVTAQDVVTTYNGEAHKLNILVKDGDTTIDDATITYSTTENGDYTATHPECKNVSGSPYTVWFKVSKEGYDDVEATSKTITINKATWDGEPAVADSLNGVISYKGGDVVFTVTGVPAGGTLTAVCDKKPGETIEFSYESATQSWKGTNTIAENESGATHTVTFTYTNGNYNAISVPQHTITQNNSATLTAEVPAGLQLGRSDYAQYGIAGEITSNEVELTVTESALLKAWADETKHATLSVDPGPFCDHGSFWAKVMFEVPEGFDKNTWKIYEAATEAAVKTETTEYTGYDIETSGGKTYFVEWFGVADVDASDVLTVRASRNVGSLYYRFNDGTDDVAISVIKVNITKVDKTDLSDAKAAVEGATYTALESTAVNAEADVQTAVETIVNAAIASMDGVSATVTKTTYTPAVDGAALGENGTNGSYKFTVTLSHDNAVADVTTEELTMVINAQAYEPADVTIAVTLGSNVTSVTYTVDGVEKTPLTASGNIAAKEGQTVTIIGATFANGYELDAVTGATGTAFPYTVNTTAVGVTAKQTAPTTKTIAVTLGSNVASVKYKIDNGEEQTLSATGNITAGTSAVVTITAITYANGYEKDAITGVTGSDFPYTVSGTAVSVTAKQTQSQGGETETYTATLAAGSTLPYTVNIFTFQDGGSINADTITIEGTDFTKNYKTGGNTTSNGTIEFAKIVTQAKNAIKVVAPGPGTLKVWFKNGNTGSSSRGITVYKLNAEGTELTQIGQELLSANNGNATAVKEFTLDSYGTYYVGVSGSHGDVSIYKLEATVTPDDSRPADKSALTSAIAAAEAAIAGATVSTDGEDVVTTAKWVLQSDVDTYQAAVDAAKLVKNKANATQDEVDTAKSTLDTATAAFNAAKKDGKKDASSITAPENSWYVGQLADSVFTETDGNDQDPAFTTDGTAPIATVDGVKLYLGPDKYVKYTDNSAVTTTTYPSAAFLQGKSNPGANTIPESGCFLKFVAEKRGTLHVTYAVLSNGKNVAITKVNGETETEIFKGSKDKAAYTQDVTVVSGDNVYFTITNSSKVGIVGFYFEENTTPAFTVTYEAAADEGTPSYTKASETVDQGASVTLPAAPTAAGYTFVKWYLKTDAEKTAITTAQTITADVTFVAYFTKDEGQGGTEPEKADMTALTAAIQSAEALGDVTVSTDGSDVLPTEKWMTQPEKQELADALAAAKLLTEDNTQAEVDAATSRLNTAKGKLKNGTKVVVTKSQLESAVNTATKLADGTDVANDGSNTSRNKKWVEQGVMDTYKAAIQAAAAVAADPSATEDVYKAAKATLDAATEVFNTAAKFGEKAGSSSSSRPSGGSGDSGDTTTPTKPVTTTETKPNGTQVTTTKNPDGTVNQTITNTDGTKTSAVTKADGETTATVTVPDRVDSTKVTVPVEGADSGTVAIIVNADGSEEIIRDSAVTEDGVVFELEDSATVKIVNKAKKFVDIDGHWAKKNVDFVSARELFNGVDADHFAPDATMTRGMMATVLFRLDGENSGDVKGSFNDVKDGVWYSDAVEWASDSNIVNGYTDGTFAPDRNITREELAVMVYRYALAAGLAKADEHVSALKYADADEVSSWAVSAMSWLTDHGILNGKLGNVVDPKATATRAEVSAVLERYVKLAASK